MLPGTPFWIVQGQYVAPGGYSEHIQQPPTENVPGDEAIQKTEQQNAQLDERERQKKGLFENPNWQEGQIERLFDKIQGKEGGSIEGNLRRQEKDRKVENATPEFGNSRNATPSAWDSQNSTPEGSRNATPELGNRNERPGRGVKRKMGPPLGATAGPGPGMVVAAESRKWESGKVALDDSSVDDNDANLPHDYYGQQGDYSDVN